MFYFIDNDYENGSKSELDKFYLKLDIELKSYVDHLLRSISAYEKEKADIDQKLKKLFPNYNIVEKNYNELFSNNLKMGYDEHSAHQLAYYESGLDQIDSEIRSQEEESFNTFIYIENTFYKSSLIYLYSILESHLRDLCIILKNKFQVNLDITDLSNRNYIDTSFIYLSKVIGIKDNNIDPYKKVLKDFQTIRNILVHDLGDINNSKIDLITSIISQYDGIEINEQKILLTNNTAIVTLLKNIILMFQELYWLIDERDSYNKLISNISKALKFISKDLTIDELEVIYGKLNENHFRSKNLKFNVRFKNKNISVITVSIKNHKTKESVHFKLNNKISLLSTFEINFRRLSEQTRKDPTTFINGVFRFFYFTHKLYKRVEINIA